MLKNRNFVEITKESSYFGLGFFGLGFPKFSHSSKDLSPIDRLKSQGLINERVFCFHLNDKMDKIGGELIIGGCDVQTTHYLPLTLEKWWQVNLTSIKIMRRNEDGTVNPEPFEDCKTGCNATLDSGWSHAGIPHDHFTKIMEALGGKWNVEHEQFLINCNENLQPDIEFDFNGFLVVLKPSDYTIHNVSKTFMFITK